MVMVILVKFKWIPRNWATKLGYDQPGECGIGRVGNKKVTSKCDHRYQRLDGEARISCR